MSTPKSARTRLELAAVEQTLVRVVRRPKYAAGYLEGFVVQVGAGWAILAKVTEGGWFDGYIAFRLKDVTSVKRDKGFSSRFARSQPEWPPSSPFAAFAVDDVIDVLRAFGANRVLFGIEKEHEREAIWIGVLDELWPKWLWLQEVDAKAQWSARPLGHKLKAVTTIASGDRYQQALSQIAGAPPELVAHEL
jgi:hypothetical protein